MSGVVDGPNLTGIVVIRLDICCRTLHYVSGRRGARAGEGKQRSWAEASGSSYRGGGSQRRHNNVVIVRLFDIRPVLTGRLAPLLWYLARVAADNAKQNALNRSRRRMRKYEAYVTVNPIRQGLPPKKMMNKPSRAINRAGEMGGGSWEPQPCNVAVVSARLRNVRRARPVVNGAMRYVKGSQQRYRVGYDAPGALRAAPPRSFRGAIYWDWTSACEKRGRRASVGCSAPTAFVFATMTRTLGTSNSKSRYRYTLRGHEREHTRAPALRPVARPCSMMGHLDVRRPPAHPLPPSAPSLLSSSTCLGGEGACSRLPFLVFACKAPPCAPASGVSRPIGWLQRGPVNMSSADGMDGAPLGLMGEGVPAARVEPRARARCDASRHRGCARGWWRRRNDARARSGGEDQTSRWVGVMGRWCARRNFGQRRLRVGGTPRRARGPLRPA
ncbi:hypothetical protein C2E23DRAFT_861473 [Lenzites betulinus]|nr:hypothetical protein C2E23DRAFT_861473 [Lenzites betulinus]